MLVDKTCAFDSYETPRGVLDCVRGYYGGIIPLDPATSESNPVGANKYYTELVDGLVQKWDDGVFVNPPYGRKLRRWVEKIGKEVMDGCEVLALLPSNRMETIYFQDNLMIDELIGMCLVRGRLSFLKGGKECGGGNPWGSIVYGFNINFSKFMESFEGIGKCIRVDFA